MYQKVKGTIDYYGAEAKKLQIVSKKVKDIIENFGYEEVVLPIIENTEVFTRSSGETSDIVRKEMYTFEDRGKRSLTLRPEGTAGVVRFFLESKEYANLDLKKYYYFGPMFRYERPQKGRYRQFIQFGVEVFGKSSYLLDVDVI
ncbi:MAG TPA: ATP phosphoribosyltransferase regulatory subunit, partial [Bacilli bacterium]|nr:ATP phosphoribosyltransferase regulatory subunit [Bacilli bacterium]